MASKKDLPAYQNNPFFVASDGLTLLFKLAQSVAILLIIICGVGLMSGFAPSPSSSYEEPDRSSFTDPDDAFNEFTQQLTQVSTETWVMIGVIATIILLGFTTIGVILGGISDYTSAQLAAGKQTTLNQAFRATLGRFFGYLWLQILIGIKVLLWSLLLIVPGIIMAIRYSLSGTAFFSENLGAQAATKRSAALTKGAWLTTYSSLSLFNIITIGIIQPLLQPGIAAILFRQYTAYDAQNIDKPKAHILSWITLFAPIVLVLLFVGLIVTLVFALSNQFS